MGFSDLRLRLLCHRLRSLPKSIVIGCISLTVIWFYLAARRPDYVADNLIVGCGLSGVILARLQAELQGETSVILEKRDHIAGNMYDFVDPNAIRVSLYGPHFFHTKKEKVWTFLTRFAKWLPFENRVLAEVRGKLAPVPVGIDTVNILMNQTLRTEDEMKQWLEMTQVKYPKGPQNAEEAAKARVGEELYAMLFEGYTTKQWDRSPKDLDASVTQRIPVRSNHDERYFSDPHQAEPEYGFTGLIASMLDHPKIKYYLNTDFFTFRKTHDISRYKKIFYTGPIDQYFVAQGYEKLEYRSLRFESVTKQRPSPDTFVQKSVQVNRPLLDVPFTRSCEYLYIPWLPRPPASSTASTLIYEFPANDGEPYYPVPNPRNQELFLKYQALAKKEEEQHSVYFIGRLANYKYFNMDDAALNALQFYERLYNMRFPVIKQDLIAVTTTWAGKGQATPVDLLTGQFYKPRLEARLWNLCRTGYAMLQDGNTYWFVVEDGEQPDSLVKDLIFSLGFQHYAYASAGPSPTGSRGSLAKQFATSYIKENAMDESATVFWVDETEPISPETFSAMRSGANAGGVKLGGVNSVDMETKSPAGAFCAGRLRQLGVAVSSSSPLRTCGLFGALLLPLLLG